MVDTINQKKTLLLVDKLSKEELEILLSEGCVTCEGQVFSLETLKEGGKFKEPYRTALVLKILGKTTGTLLCALGLIDCEGAYGRKIGQELGKDDNYIRQLLNLLERIGILTSSGGKGKQRIFSLREDLVILPRGQLTDILEGKPVSLRSVVVRELKEGRISLEELFFALYDENIHQIITPREVEKFEVGQLIESMVKSGVVSASARRVQYLTFYQLLELLNTVRQRIPLDADGNVLGADLTRIVSEELQKGDETGELSRRYRDYVQYRIRKKIVNGERSVTIDFSTLKDAITRIAQNKGIELTGKMRSEIAEDIITSLKGLPITSFKEAFIEEFICNLLEDRFLITSSEKMMNQAETLLRVGERLLENAKDIKALDTTRSREYVREASLDVLSVLLFLYGEVPPQKLSLMEKAFMKKKGDQSVLTLLVEDFAAVRKDKKLRETEAFQRVKEVLEEKVQAFDAARFLKNNLEHMKEELDLEESLETAEVILLMGSLLFEFKTTETG